MFKETGLQEEGSRFKALRWGYVAGGSEGPPGGQRGLELNVCTKPTPPPPRTQSCPPRTSIRLR